MVTLDTRDVGAPLADRSTRRYTADDLPWATDLLARTVGRQRFRRGSVLDAASLQGLVALDGVVPTGLATLLKHRDEIEVVAVTAEPGDEFTIGQLLAAVVAGRGDECRRIFVVCYNAELGLHRLVQQSGFQLCAVRPGAVAAARKPMESGRIPATIGGIPVRDEVEFDLLLR